ncbi:P-loop containing nucleoside triphosphate hydrolase protein [Coniella lustricola]|uniref:RNA helicase n=1 Tax=Coniella lustricola TaxID=2025994 RepID=A0A2T3AH28_9PEZI|nr:P-loop containing nucleoside triphosphate hydrolase protein [Coniella lustricola]
MGFFSRKKKDANANPYAQDVPFANPMTPYQQARNNVAQGMSVAPPESAPTPPPAYQNPPVVNTGYGDEKYGNQSGYGGNRYGASGPNASGPASGRYGGFDTDAGKSDLFGGAASRPGAGQQGYQPSAAPDNDNRNPALFGNAQDRYNPANVGQQGAVPGAADDEYGGYGAARELTEEEREEQEVQGTKNEIKAVRQAGIESLDRTIAMGEAAYDQILGSRMRLAEQEERLRNAEKNLDVAAIHAKDGSDKTKTLDKLNRTPFFIPVGQGKKARAKEVEAAMDRHREEKDIREQTRHEAFADQQRMEETTKQAMRDPIGIKQLGTKKPANDRFAFEEDDEDNEQEQMLGERLNRVNMVSEKLNLVSGFMSEDLVRSNQGLDRIGTKVDRVDDNVRAFLMLRILKLGCKLYAFPVVGGVLPHLSLEYAYCKREQNQIQVFCRRALVYTLRQLLACCSVANPVPEMPKRRKTSENGAFIKIGDKIISIESYLNGGINKKSTKDDKSPNIPTAPTADEGSQQVERLDSESRIEKDSTSTISQRAAHQERGDAELLKTREKLPIWKHRNDLRKSLKTNDALVIVAETGSGKSTQIPQFLAYEDWCTKKKVNVRNGTHTEEAFVGGMIAITQPRRVAATTLAHRVAKEAGTPLRQDGIHREGLVGYSVRFDQHVPKGTKIKFLTEGMLLQELLRDPHLRKYSAVIIDEIHERSIDVDLLSGFVKQIIGGDKAGRGGVPLKVAIMSATADVDKVKSFFTVEVAGTLKEPAYFNIPGRLFPVDIIYAPRPVPDVQDALIKTITRIHTEQPCPGDILAFLTGQEEIEATQKILEDYAQTLDPKMPKLVPVPLFGQMSIEAQQTAFQPVPGRIARKVVLSTNIAETSVTVPGVRYVIDTGKAKVKQYRVRLGMESLLPKPISKSSAIQRTGRAGREGPGQCYRLYTEDSYENLFKDSDLPEILRIDILGAALTMKARGIDDVFAFPLMDTPDDEAFEKALVHLHVLGAITDDGRLSEMGKKMAKFPVAVPYGRVLLAAADPKNACLLDVIDIISCLTAGDDIFHQLRSEEQIEEVRDCRMEVTRREGDLLTYLTTMQRYAAEHADRLDWCKRRRINIRVMKQALNIRKQLRGLCLREQMLDEIPQADPQPFTPASPERAEIILKCFLAGFAMRTALLAPDASYVTSFGKHVVAIHPASVLHGQKKEAILFLEHVFTTKNYAKKVSVIQANWIFEAMKG